MSATTTFPRTKEEKKAVGESRDDEEDKLHYRAPQVIGQRHAVVECCYKDNVENRCSYRTNTCPYQFSIARIPPHAAVHAEESE